MVDRETALVFTLATWPALWAALEATCRDPALVDRLAGWPFTLDPDPLTGCDLELDVTRVRRGGYTHVLRLAARAWGGEYQATTGELRGCRLGLRGDLWGVFVC